MKRNENQETTSDHLTGLSRVPTMQAIYKRAREIALIEGHDLDDEFLEKATWELMNGESMPEHILGDEEDEETLSRNPAEPVVDRGGAAPTRHPVDAQEVEVNEINRGLMDALHEQMLLGKTSRK